MTSAVTLTPRALPRRTASTDAAAERCAMWTRPPTSSARSTSRSTMMASPAAGWPRRPSTVDTGPSFMQALLGERRLLAVVDDREVEGLRVLEGPAHDAGARHRLAVVGERDAAGLLQVAELGELLALLAAGDGADRVDPHRALRAGPLDDRARDPRGVVHGVGVGHGADRGEAAGRRRARAGRDRLLVLAPRLPQVGVDVDEARADHEALQRRGPGRPGPGRGGPPPRSCPPRSSRRGSRRAPGRGRRPARPSAAAGS